MEAEGEMEAKGEREAEGGREAEGEMEAEGGREAESEREAEGEMKANPAAKLYKKESLTPKGELGIKRRAWRQKESLARRPRRASASDLRMESVMEQVLSKVWEMMRGCISFTTFITSFIMG